MRTPELSPLMLNENQCRAYNKYSLHPMQHLEFINMYKELVGINQGVVIDLGSGPCNFVIALAERFPNLKFVCYEGSEAMISIAKENIANANMSSRIEIIHDDIFNATGTYDVVIANRLLHHINNTEQFWKLINRLSNNVLVIDINRPPIEVIEHIEKVDHYQEPIYKEDLINSMKAAYSLQEVVDQIKDYGYDAFADRFYKLYVYHTR